MKQFIFYSLKWLSEQLDMAFHTKQSNWEFVCTVSAGWLASIYKAFIKALSLRDCC